MFRASLDYLEAHFSEYIDVCDNYMYIYYIAYPPPVPAAEPDNKEEEDQEDEANSGSYA